MRTLFLIACTTATALFAADDLETLLADAVSTDDVARIAAIEALGKLPNADGRAVKAISKAYSEFLDLTSNVKDAPNEADQKLLMQRIQKSGKLYWAAARALDNLGPKAKDALPILLDDLRKNRSGVAAGAIAKIDPSLIPEASKWVALRECERVLSLQSGFIVYTPQHEYAKTFEALLPGDYLTKGEAPSAEHKSTWGYRYKLIFKQGANAPGGAKSYLENGKATLGCAILAYPIEYGKSGKEIVIGAIVQGRAVLFTKDLGERTSALIESLDTFDPDTTWTSIKSKAVIVGN